MVASWPDNGACDHNKAITGLLYNLNRFFLTMENSHDLFFSEAEANRCADAGPDRLVLNSAAIGFKFSRPLFSRSHVCTFSCSQLGGSFSDAATHIQF